MMCPLVVPSLLLVKLGILLFRLTWPEVARQLSVVMILCVGVPLRLRLWAPQMLAVTSIVLRPLWTVLKSTAWLILVPSMHLMLFLLT